MPVNSTSHDYEDYRKVADFTEIFYAGEVAIKKAGVKLVPKLSGQSDAEYKAYLDRAPIFSAVPRTVSALISTAFKKEPVFKLPPKLEYLRTDCTGTGVPLLAFTMQILRELLVTGRSGILVDLPREGGSPFLIGYDGDDILNYSQDEEPFVVLENETMVRNPDDKFDIVEKEGWRELSVEGGEYIVRLWEANEKGEPFVAEETRPLRFGRPLTEIPFVPVNTYGTDFSITEPPMLPLAQISHKHLLAACDYALALHVACCPSVLIYADIDKEEFGEFKLGPSACHILPAGSKAEWLEFSGQGITPLQLALDRYENMMGALGARLLMGQDASSEKAAGVHSRDQIANSVLTSVLTSLELALTKVLKIVAHWSGVEEDETLCSLNKELFNTVMDANMVNALVTAYMNNAIDIDVLYHNLQEGAFLPVGSDKQTFAANLKKQQDELAKREAASKPAPVPVQGVDNAEKV